MHYKESQICAARHIHIADILDNLGERYKRCGKEYYWKKHDSVRFHDNMWFQHSTGVGGMAIDFCERFLDMNFYESLDYLTGNFLSAYAEQPINSELKNGKAKPETVTNHKPIINHEAIDIREDNEATSPLPVEPDMAAQPVKAYGYLTRKRGIDPSVVSFFIGRGDIMETAKHHNIAFMGKDENGTPRNIHLRGTEDSRRFRQNVLDSDSHYGFSYFGKGNTVYAFEAPIDMLSFISMYQKDWKANSYVSLNGVSGNTLYRALYEHKNLKTIILCLDNDKAGQRGCEAIQNELMKRGYTDVNRAVSSLKDWNEDLMRIRSQENSLEYLYKNQTGGMGECHQLQSLS